MTEEKKDGEYSDFVQSLEIYDIALKASQSFSFRYPEEKDREKIKVNVNFWYHWDWKDGNFVCFTTAEIKGELEETEMFLIKATYATFYKTDYPFDKGWSVSHGFMAEFAQDNAFVHTIPYFRERFQSDLSQMGYPDFVLPLLKPGFRVEAKLLGDCECIDCKENREKEKD